ncbi:hypothetical protein GRI40_03745 [Altererythrobacter aerius]|uniref:XRE family transcriptional regulator n=1 Tax=Tsuneonella aeria TaxID=1837929 RepID=A0A6I4TCG0_9SPHN|nr:hypothetical protein [Tsuneonella aeria]MXO74337.1 hypothetical protein [Tsuneonella aeria]
MTERADSKENSLLAALRRELRAGGWTAKRIAAHFSASEASAKRWLAGRGLTLARFADLAALTGLSLAELAEAPHQPARALAQELTLAQEQALSEDSLLSFLFMVIVGGEGWEDFARDFGVPENAIEPALARLEKLALIDRLPGGRARALLDRNALWRKSPLRERFETQMKPQFVGMDFAALDAVYASEVVKLSDMGAARVAEAIERHRRELHGIAEEDRRTAVLPRRWHAVLYAARRLDGAGLREELR